MTTGIACTMALTAHLAVGGLGLFDCLKKDRHDYDGPDCCRSCLVEYRTVQDLIVVMQHHRNWRERDDAAHELRDYDWRRHPELASAVAYTMLSDCHEEVREEAAETLAKLAPCDPAAHVALERAAVGDPDHATRKWARRGLKNLDHRCLGDCPICGPLPAAGPATIVVPVPTVEEVEILPPPPRGSRTYGEVPFDRAVPLYGRPAPAPFPTPRVYREVPTEVDPAPGAVAPPVDRHESYRPAYPALPDPNARPDLLPPALPPADGAIEVSPPELPPVPPSASPFGTSRRPGAPFRPAARRDRPVFLFTVGPPR